MHKILRSLITSCLLLTLPVTVLAASGTSADKEQATIQPPSSEDNSDSSSDQDTASENGSVFSSGVDWSAANTSSSGSGTYTVCIDPGHQGSWVDMSAQEPMAPGSSQTKNKATTGTSGNFSKVPEYEVNLQVSLVLKKELIKRGYKVVMTREDNDKAISNKERAELATSEGADITVRVHANSDNSSSASGALTMAPTSSNQYLDKDIIQKSNTLASCIIDHYCAVTGLGNKGVISADNMTGTNWSTVPVAIIEMGFMSNQGDDLYITDTSHHEVMAQGIADGIDEYFSIIAPEQAAEGKHLSDLTDSLRTGYTDAMEKDGEKWAVAAMDLSTMDYSTINADRSMPSSSAIRSFIMGAVYENLVYTGEDDTPSADYKETLLPLLTGMVTANDDNASNELVKKLGNGDFAAGASAVNEFCQKHGYTSTKLEQEFSAAPSGEIAHISASDCCRLLADIYSGSLISQTASKDMLDILNQRPGGNSRNLSLVADKDHPYVLCILYADVKDDKKAQQALTGISETVNKFMTTQDNQ